MELRIGNGFDVHRFEFNENGSHIILGGVKIPHTRNLVAHSDGDVLTHSLMDAILGALSLGDIGKLFPDSDSAYKDIDSLTLLNKVNNIINEDHWQINNCDMTILAEKPKIAPHSSKIISNLQTVLKIQESRISVKATTTEQLGFTGREEGIAVLTTVLLIKS